MLCLYGPQWKQDHEYEPIELKLHYSSGWVRTHTVKDICHQLSAISLANFRAIYFSQSCRTMLLSSLSPKPRGVVTCCQICATVPFYSRWKTRGCVYNLWGGWWPCIMYYSLFYANCHWGLWFYITAQCSLCHFLPILFHCVILFLRIGALLCVLYWYFHSVCQGKIDYNNG
jgi:hypothetical protein